jgi:hypothetical protein
MLNQLPRMVTAMNRTLTSILALGAGAIAYGASRNKNDNFMSRRGMKKMRKRFMRTFS